MLGNHQNVPGLVTKLTNRAPPTAWKDGAATHKSKGSTHTPGMDPQVSSLREEMPVSEGHTLNRCTWVTFSEWQKYGNGEQLRGGRGQGCWRTEVAVTTQGGRTLIAGILPQLYMRRDDTKLCTLYLHPLLGLAVILQSGIVWPCTVCATSRAYITV